MKVSISKIVIFCFVFFSLFVFWKGLKNNNNYDTKNLIGSKISKFQLTKINNDAKYIYEKKIKKNKFTLINFLEELGNPYNFVGKDLKGKISILFGIYGIPESLLVDSDLNVIKKIVGPIDQIQYDEILKITR